MINRQQHNTDCGPVAIKNALEAKGIRSSYKEILDFSKSYLNFNHDGMNIDEIEMGLTYLGLNPRYCRDVSSKTISKLLDQGKVLILLYRWYSNGRNNGHFVMIDRETDKHVRAWNWTSKKGHSAMMPKWYLTKVLRYSSRHHKGYPQLIVI